MHSFKKSLIALAGLLVLFGAIAALTPLASRGQGKQQRGPRKYYLTQSQHDGSQTLSACAEGYHMASLWEIHDPSNLRYDTTLGFTTADSGSGPPASLNSNGWIRTGNVASPGSGVLGQSNCSAWTTAASTATGSVAGLHFSWTAGVVTVVSPWYGVEATCDTNVRVWCVQD